MAGQVDEFSARRGEDEDTQQTDGARVIEQSTRVRSWLDRTFNWTWRTLRHPAPLQLVALLLLLLLIGARIVPQMPGQIAEDPAAAERWVNEQAGNWGSLMPFLRGLELFAVQGSDLLRALLALLVLLAALHLADALGALLLWRTLPRAAAASSAQEDAAADDVQHAAPAVLPGAEIGRTRFALPYASPQAVAAVETWARQRYGAGMVELAAESRAESAATAARGWLLRRNGVSVWLRPLLPLGLLLAALAMWAGAAFGWDVRPPTFAPGDTFTSASHGFTLTYAPADAPADASADASASTDAGGDADTSASMQLILQQGDHAQVITPDGTRATPFGYAVEATQGSPGLYLHTDQPALLLPGGTQSSREAGLLFAQPGSEQFVVLPEQGAGMRFVRITDGTEDLYFVEVYNEDDEQPLERLQIERQMTLSVTGVADSLAIDVIPAVGIDVVVESKPLTVLFWPALLLVLAGLLAYLRPAAFALVQVGPWQQDGSVVTAQGSDIAEITAIEAALKATS